jgi:hypothetical protein
MAKVLAKVKHLMDLSKITTSTLEALVKLTKRRDGILGELKGIEAAISSAYSGRKSELSRAAAEKARRRAAPLPREPKRPRSRELKAAVGGAH